jgi:radical SAM superfamily enzyme YgiQ (UPF0313 family)
MSEIVLATLNARYVHASLGLRCIAANMGELRARTGIREFVLGAKTSEVVEQLLAECPRIVGFGVYIWNVEETTRIVAMLKTVAPDVVVILGGPEVSHETDGQRICSYADYVITGWGDLSFPQLCREVLDGSRPRGKVIKGEQPPLDNLELPYAEYADRDIARRFLYIEASRGCPFKCEFCLSALDRTAWAFDQDKVLASLAMLHDRGARHFRFVDRTFNLKASAGARILRFFLDRMDDDLFVHFEVVPDHLPDALKGLITQFPAGALQFEVGIQTWNTEVQALISRRQDNAQAEENLRWLREASNALVHVDLIAGLPGEDLESFGRGFDRLLALRPHEIQVGILKRLRGAPIARHTDSHAMRYNPEPPYNVLSTGLIPFADMQRVSRFARYWDMLANSGRFPSVLPHLTGGRPYESFMAFSDWLYARSGKTHEIPLEKLCEWVYAWLTTGAGMASADAAALVSGDFEASGASGRLSFMPAGVRAGAARARAAREGLRQARHLLT